MIAQALPDNIIAMPQKSNEWYTPARYVDAAREVLGTIDLDPASCEIANRTVKATRYYTQRENGLMQPWYGNVWLNPPFGRVNPELKGSTRSLQKYFALECHRRYQTQEITQAIILLFGTSLCMPWFVPLWEYPVCIPRLRINFDTAAGPQDHFGYGNIFVYLGPSEQTFIDVFSRFGRIARAIDTPAPRPMNLSLWEAKA